MMTKTEKSFGEGLKNLRITSFSADDVLRCLPHYADFGEEAPKLHFGPGLAEEGKWFEEHFDFSDHEVVGAALAKFAVESAAALGWDPAVHSYSEDFSSFAYETRAGLKFGWRQKGKSWVFFVGHPSGNFPEGSTLKTALVEAGYIEE
jgi:hypothetical protein